MATRIVRTRRSRLQIKQIVRMLPLTLRGRAPDPFGLRLAFLAAFIRSLFVQAHESFIARAHAQHTADPAWMAVASSTLRRKRSLSRRGLLVDMPEAINIRTGALLRSYTPGPVTENQYVPGDTNQTVLIYPNQVVLDSKLDYANRVFSLRPLWPDDNRWVSKALDAGCNALTAKLARVLTY